jgi:RND family efflux transporter MFP subunit
MKASDRSPEPEDSLRQLLSLSEFRGEPSQFWRRYLSALTAFCGAGSGCVLIRSEARWAEAAGYPAAQMAALELDGDLLNGWATLVEDCPTGGVFSRASASGEQRFAVAPLKPEPGDTLALAVLRVAGSDGATILEKLSLALRIPERFEMGRLLSAARHDASRLANALDLMALLNGHARFGAAAMALCNELVTRFGCERVSLGWMEKNCIVVKAMSHTEKLEPKMDAVQQLCALMEEACDQEEEILWPRPEGQAFITRDHEIYARAQGAAFLATLPLFSPVLSDQTEGEAPQPIGALTAERGRSPFSIEELRTLRLMLDQAARPLADLHRADGWFGARWAAAARTVAGKALGPEHTWWKLLGVALGIGLVIVAFCSKDYRIEGTFALKTDAMAHLSAPFEGHLESVSAKPGDLVKSGATLVTLDRRELLLQKEAAVAERGRHVADALKAESSGDVAGMRIAQAREAQARAQTDIVSDRLARAEVKAPFDGVVVEGDLREKIAAPVQKGEVLVKIARIQDLYLVVEVPERDIQDVREGAAGHAAFSSLPGKKFAILVERIEPLARSKEKGNLFSVRCRFTEAADDWWRPGMSGVARIDAGRRSLLWIGTHRTVDFLRMWWW